LLPPPCFLSPLSEGEAGQREEGMGKRVCGKRERKEWGRECVARERGKSGRECVRRWREEGKASQREAKRASGTVPQQGQDLTHLISV